MCDGLHHNVGIPPEYVKGQRYLFKMQQMYVGFDKPFIE
jgi:hypothetical protein